MSPTAATMKWPDSPDGLSADWVFANGSNVHVCNDRRWFAEFVAFPSSAESAYFASEKLSVVGVGTVNLPVKRSPNLRGSRAHHLLRLTEVLYIPSSVCNIIGFPIYDIIDGVSMGGTEKSRGVMTDASGKPLAYFSPDTETSLACLKLSGPPVGPKLAPSKLQSDVVYVLSVIWPDNERARWKSLDQHTMADNQKRQWVGEQPYTAEEKKWLKKHYGGEFKFLCLYGLSIYNEEDRAEGRAIMRTLSRADESNDENDGGDDDDQKGKDEDEDEDEEEFCEEDDEEDEEEEDDSDLENHLADYHFNEEELDWIEKHYQNSATFMISYGLKFYDDDDCATAKQLVQDFLGE